jgi:hypothetical protein
VVTLAFLLLIGVALDQAFRVVLPRLSLNSRILAAGPQRAARLRSSVAETKILILGNSVGREGIDTELLEQRLRGGGADVHIEHQPADSSDMREWYYQLRNQFLVEGAVPDVLVLPVGLYQPLTRQEKPSEDLLVSFLRWPDLPDFFRASKIDAPSDRAEILFARCFTPYNFRGRLQKRVLSEMVAGYRGMMEHLAGLRQRGTPDRHPTSLVWPTRLAELARDHRIRVIVVAMPTAELHATLPAEDRQLADRLGWMVVEPAEPTAFDAQDHPDGHHLTPAARTRFTLLLWASLGAKLSAGIRPPLEAAP